MALSKANKDKYIRFISTSLDPNWVVTNYYKRWKIEVFFEDVKTKGFNLEELNLTDMKKIRLIVAVTSFCYTLCLKEGLIEFKERPMPMKKDTYSGKFYPRTSIFTRGYEIIVKSLLNLSSIIASFLNDNWNTSSLLIDHFLNLKPKS